MKELITIPNIILIVAGGFIAGAKSRPQHIYAHNLECSIAAVFLGKVLRTSVTCDFHGDEIEENLAAYGWKRNGLRFKLWRRVMKTSLSMSPVVVCVSNKHRLHFESIYGRRGPVLVIPCCSSSQNTALDGTEEQTVARIADSIKDRFVLLYSGSSSAHQLIPEMAKLHHTLIRIGMKSLLLLLISDKKALTNTSRILGGQSANSIILESVSRGVAERLAELANVGLLFRTDEVFNNISSPTKFSEYLLAGLPVVMTSRVGDYSEIVSTERLGAVIDLSRIEETDYVAEIAKGIVADVGTRARCRRYGERCLTWSSIEDTVSKAYRLD